jgi:hypothetical protein
LNALPLGGGEGDFLSDGFEFSDLGQSAGQVGLFVEFDGGGLVADTAAISTVPRGFAAWLNRNPARASRITSKSRNGHLVVRGGVSYIMSWVSVSNLFKVVALFSRRMKFSVQF